MELFSPVFLPPEFPLCVSSLALSVGSEFRVSQKTLLIPKAGGKAHPSLVNPPGGSSAGTWWVKKPKGMGKYGGSKPWHLDSQQFLQFGGEAWTCWLNQGHGMRRSRAVEPGFARDNQLLKHHKVRFKIPRSLSEGWSWLFINLSQGEPALPCCQSCPGSGDTSERPCGMRAARGWHPDCSAGKPSLVLEGGPGSFGMQPPLSMDPSWQPAGALLGWAALALPAPSWHLLKDRESRSL